MLNENDRTKYKCLRTCYKKLKKLAEDSKKLETIIEEIKNNKIYEEAFEWRFEFPEVLDDNGDFVGFDAVIGNPPYIFSRELITNQEKNYFNENYKLTQFKLNTYILFSELASKIGNNNGIIAYIIPNNWLTLQYNSQFREFILKGFQDIKIINDKNKTFEDASVDASILLLSKKGIGKTKCYELNNTVFELISETDNLNYLNENGSIINYSLYKNPELALILNQINNHSKLLDTDFIVKNGVQAYTVGEGIPTQTKEMKDSRVYHSTSKLDNNWIKYIDGSDVSRYALNWSGLFIKYGKNLSRRRTPELFEGERIYVRQIPSKPPYAIVSTILNMDAVCDNNHMVI